MNRILCLVREHLAALGGETDQRLLHDFHTLRDEAAFAELVRRYGPVVWGVCRRRLNNFQDAEDAFQATFLVLIRRAASITPTTPLGPWLHRVAVMTSRNVLRQQRRRAAISGPMEHEVATTTTDPDLGLDLDAALLALPERDRVPIVLCHLQGLSRREAAERLACPEGTLSARLHRALARLRARLGDRSLAALGVASATAVPADLAAATVRSAVIFMTSSSTAAGLSPAVAGITDGVLRMFWMKKLVAGLAVMMMVAGGLFVCLAGRIVNVARATDPEPMVPLVGEPEASPQDPAAEKKRLEQQKAELEKRKAELDQLTSDLNRQLAKFDAALLARQAAAELCNDMAVVVTEGGRGIGWNKPPYTVREVINGKVGEMQCYELEILHKYLSRAFNDPKGPKKLRVYADQNFSHDQIHKLMAVCSQAGYQKALFILPEAPLIASGVDPTTGKVEKVERGEKETEIDLTNYARKKP